MLISIVFPLSNNVRRGNGWAGNQTWKSFECLPPANGLNQIKMKRKLCVFLQFILNNGDLKWAILHAPILQAKLEIRPQKLDNSDSAKNKYGLSKMRSKS